MTVPASVPSVTSPPAACPFCRSEKISTASKAVSDATYWRCEQCGQIWNPSRLLAYRGRR